MKNLFLYRVKLFVKTLKNPAERIGFLITALLISTIVLLPSYAESTLNQEIAQEVTNALDNDIRDAIVEHLAQLEIEARKKTETKDTSKTLEREQETVKEDILTEKDNRTTTTTETTIAANKTVTPIIKKEEKKELLSVNKKTEVAVIEKKRPSISNSRSEDKNRNKTITKKKTVVKRKMTTVGWIYLGRFTSGRWENPTLASKALPKVKQHYKIMATSVNVRDRLPKKDETGELVLGTSIKQLVDKQEVALLKLKRSGRNGHYWAKIGVLGK